MSECRALTNLTGNGVACVVVAWWEGELDRDKLNAGLTQQVDPRNIEEEQLRQVDCNNRSGNHPRLLQCTPDVRCGSTTDIPRCLRHVCFAPISGHLPARVTRRLWAKRQTFRLLLDIIVGGQGCSSSWSITRETYPVAISAPGRGRCRAAGPVAERECEDTYPTRSVRLIVGFPAGNAFDTFARLIAQWLSERLGQQFVVENRPGAGGNVGTEVVVRASPDGYTLLLVLTSNAINATLYANLNFDFIRDIAPVASRPTPLMQWW